MPLGLLEQACGDIAAPFERLALLTYRLNRPQLLDLAKDLRFPKDTLQLCVQLSMQQRKLRHYQALDATQKHALLSVCGALKSTKQLDRLMALCVYIEQAEQDPALPESQGSVEARFQIMQQAMHQDLRAIAQIKPQTYLDQGLQGKALGDALRLGQIAAIS